MYWQEPDTCAFGLVFLDEDLGVPGGGCNNAYCGHYVLYTLANYNCHSSLFMLLGDHKNIQFKWLCWVTMKTFSSSGFSGWPWRHSVQVAFLGDHEGIQFKWLFWVTMKAFSSSGFSGWPWRHSVQVAFLGDHEDIQFKWFFWLPSDVGISMIVPRLLVLAQFQEQILKCFPDRRLAFVMLHRRPIFFSHLSFSACFLMNLGALEWRLETGAQSQVCWRDIVIWFRFIACMLNTEGPSRSLWESPRARESAVGVLL